VSQKFTESNDFIMPVPNNWHGHLTFRVIIIKVNRKLTNYKGKYIWEPRDMMAFYS